MSTRGMRRILLYGLQGVVGLAIAGLVRQRQRPIPIPPPLTFLFENPLVEAFAGSELLVERLDLAPGMRVLDAGCGPGRLTIPVARAVEPTGEIVALDSQRAMLEKLEPRLEVLLHVAQDVALARGQVGQAATRVGRPGPHRQDQLRP